MKPQTSLKVQIKKKRSSRRDHAWDKARKLAPANNDEALIQAQMQAADRGGATMTAREKKMVKQAEERDDVKQARDLLEKLHYRCEHHNKGSRMIVYICMHMSIASIFKVYVFLFCFWC